MEEGLLAIRREQARALEAYGVIHADEYDKMYNATRGAQEGIKAYMEENAKAGESAKQAVGNGTRSMEDALTKFVTTGKLDFKGFIDTVIAEFARLAVVNTPNGTMLLGEARLGGALPGAQIKNNDGTATAVPVVETPVCKASLVALAASPVEVAAEVPMVLWVAALEAAATVVRAAPV